MAKLEKNGFDKNLPRRNKKVSSVLPPELFNCLVGVAT